VEGARIDHASHQNDLLRAVTETVVFAEAVASAAAMTDPEETLIVVTADHETGGLRLVSESDADTSEADGNADGAADSAGAENTLPDAAWGTEGHTATDVPLYARGPFAEEFRGRLALSEIHGILARALAQ
jgi:alkaline phosphatase